MEDKLQKELKYVFEENGLLAQIGENYEYRQAQADMAFAVLSSLCDNDFSLIDAPTGIGKSLAYLIPSFLYASQSGKRVVVATDTNALLYQLVTKDAPFAKKILKSIIPDYNLNYAWLQGKNRYLCYLRYEGFLNVNSSYLFDYNLTKNEYEYLKSFHSVTKFSCIDEADTSQSWIARIWDNVNISDNTLCRDCKYKNDKCHYYSVLMKKVHSCSVLITNHSLILSDAKMKREDEEFYGEEKVGDTVLPKYEKLVIDEAHGLIKNCERAFEIEYSTSSLISILNRLIQKERNLFFALADITQQEGNISKDNDNFTSDRAIAVTLKIEEIIKLNKRLVDNIALLLKSRNINLKEIGFWELNPPSDTLRLIAEIKDMIINIVLGFSSIKETEKNANLRNEIARYIKVIGDMAETLDSVLNSKKIFNTATIYWLEYTPQSRLFSSSVSFKAMPIFPAKNLNKLLYKDLGSCVFTSATLDSGDNFNFFAENTGIYNSEKKINKFIYSSPFDYAKNTLQVFVNDIDSANSNDISNEKCSNFISQAILSSRGGALILFTSFASLNDIFMRVKEKLKNSKIRLFQQGSGESNAALIEKFKKDKDSVLFATSSFWQGVDFSGETLRLLVVHKMPFAVPSTPLHRAREAELAHIGKKYFFEYDIPEVIVKMRQGLGRLMRKASDVGVIAVLDNRIANNNYYKAKIYTALDKNNSSIENSQNALLKISQFFENKILAKVDRYEF